MKILDPIKAIFGHKYVWDIHSQRVKFASTSLFDTLNNIELKKSDDNDEQTPIFIFSAGWRSGSTLLQRIICSSDNELVWGEPFGDTGLIEYLVEPLRRFSRSRPHKQNYIENIINDSHFKDLWIANLYPSADDLRAGYKAFFDRTFMQSAKLYGANSWGLKEVRLDAEHAYFFKWLYPKAKIIFLVRNPKHAFASYAKYKNWYHIRPQSPVFTANAFANHWQKLATSYIKHTDTVGAHLIKYEDLINNSETLNELEEYLGVKVDRNILDNKIKSTSDDAYNNKLVVGENLILKLKLKSTAAKLGYKL